MCCSIEGLRRRGIVELAIPERADRPEHVPQGLVVDFDIYGFPVHNGEFQLALLKLREQEIPPIFWTPRNGGHWLATRAADIKRVLTDPATFSSRKSSVPKELAPDPPLPPMQSDPPAHSQFRKLLSRPLSPQGVSVLEGDIRSLAIELIEGFAPKGECEFIGDFARHMPIAIFMSIVDLPSSDRLQLLRITEACMRPEKPEDRLAGFAALGAYSLKKVRERRANPGTDLISEITRAQVDGQLLSDEVVANVVTLLLTAGLDTVVAMLGFFVRVLALNPAHRRQLNEDAFDDPLSVNFKRRTIPHLTFGGGPHRCMGAMLARTELQIFLQEWLARIPDFSIRPDFEVKVRSRVVTTIPALPLVWAAAT